MRRTPLRPRSQSDHKRKEAELDRLCSEWRNKPSRGEG